MSARGNALKMSNMRRRLWRCSHVCPMRRAARLYYGTLFDEHVCKIILIRIIFRQRAIGRNEIFLCVPHTKE